MSKGVYAIRSRVSLREDGLGFKEYIGSTGRSFRVRYDEHRDVLRLGDHHSRPLQRDWDKYGEESFEFVEITIFRDDDVRETILAEEQRYLDDRQPWIDEGNGYNCRRKADSMLGRRQTEPEKDLRRQSYRDESPRYTCKRCGSSVSRLEAWHSTRQGCKYCPDDKCGDNHRGITWENKYSQERADRMRDDQRMLNTVIVYQCECLTTYTRSQWQIRCGRYNQSSCFVCGRHFSTNSEFDSRWAPEALLQVEKETSRGNRTQDRLLMQEIWEAGREQRELERRAKISLSRRKCKLGCSCGRHQGIRTARLRHVYTCECGEEFNVARVSAFQRWEKSCQCGRELSFVEYRPSLGDDK